MTPRQQKIKALIETSPVLTALERQDWLEMLELMNDKQLGELENILQTPEPRNPQTGARNASNQIPAQGLSHIANLPAGVKLNASPSPKPAPANKWLDEMKLVMSEKELPAPRPQSPPLNRPPAASKQQAIRPEVRVSAPAEIEVEAGPNAPVNWEPRSAEDAALLSVAIYRNLGEAKLLSILQTLVKREGYAKVLVALEKSHLHKAYVAAGHNFLVAGVEEAKSVISKKEFEEIADLFRSIQIN